MAPHSSCHLESHQFSIYIRKVDSLLVFDFCCLDYHVLCVNVLRESRATVFELTQAFVSKSPDNLSLRNSMRTLIRGDKYFLEG